MINLISDQCLKMKVTNHFQRYERNTWTKNLIMASFGDDNEFCIQGNHDRRTAKKFYGYINFTDWSEMRKVTDCDHL